MFIDNYRSILTGEPRGHAPMHAAIYVPSKSHEYDFELILMSALGYLDMCGHALIGSATSLLSNNIFLLKKTNQSIKISTCSGIIRVKANLKKNHIESITFTNQESFAIEKEYKISVPHYGNISVNIAYGGLWYILVNSKNSNDPLATRPLMIGLKKKGNPRHPLYTSNAKELREFKL